MGCRRNSTSAQQCLGEAATRGSGHGCQPHTTASNPRLVSDVSTMVTATASNNPYSRPAKGRREQHRSLPGGDRDVACVKR